MQRTDLVVQADDPVLKSEIVAELVKQLRALDTYDTQKDWSNLQVIDPLVLTKERKQAIPIIGDPDEITLARVRAYYNALATLIEKKSGLMAVPVINLTHEGFGRAFVIVGKLLVVDKTLRDVHRFGFASLAKLDEEVTKLLDKALGLIGQYSEVANA
ncbi:MAG TPA: NifX-associated nitrogen fixation protein [Methylococcaceae bacterium]|nr:NifX-associated nitrogen fixation protein [Methylococcaceae bacterium]